MPGPPGLPLFAPVLPPVSSVPSSSHLSAADCAAFLAAQLPLQQHTVQHHFIDGQQVWLKRAGAPRSALGHRLLGAIAWLLRLPVLQPVPNPGGRAAIAAEVQRLRDFAAHGLRVPTVLAAQPDGFLMTHLGTPDHNPQPLGNEMEQAERVGPEAVLALWTLGLDAITHVHASGRVLSQAFARNLVHCPDGVVGFIDFEDDPAAHLPLPLCRARDALCYAHSTALILRRSGALPAARAQWAAWLATRDAEMRTVLESTAQRLGWLRHLPEDRRWGSDLQRVRAAYDLLVA